MKALRGCGLLPWLVGAISLIMLGQGLAFAADPNPPTVMALSLNAGETYVINNVSPGATPQVKVITNPNALVIHNEEPGKVTLARRSGGRMDRRGQAGRRHRSKLRRHGQRGRQYQQHQSSRDRSSSDHGQRCERRQCGSSSGDAGSGRRPCCISRFVLVVFEFVLIDERNHHDHGSRAGNGSLVERTCAFERRACTGCSSGSKSFDFRFLSDRAGCQLWYDSCGSGSDRIGSIIVRAISRRSFRESNRRRAALGCDYRRTALSA